MSGLGPKLDTRAVDIAEQGQTTLYAQDAIKVMAMGIPYGNLPTLAYRVGTQAVTVVFSSDQNPRFPDFGECG